MTSLLTTITDSKVISHEFTKLVINEDKRRYFGRNPEDFKTSCRIQTVVNS